MSLIPREKLKLFNANLLNESPEEIINFALELSSKPILTTSFGRFSEVIIHTLTNNAPDIKTLWCDTGYNSFETYGHGAYLTDKYNLNLEVLTPEYTRAYTEFKWGVPGLDNPNHDQLTQVLKIDPLTKAFKRLKPDLWFTNIRKGQTALRDQLDVLSLSPDGILKVSPFYHCMDEQLLNFIRRKNLRENSNYFDPIKNHLQRECGIHLSN